jgi:hypothetical protein
MVRADGAPVVAGGLLALLAATGLVLLPLPLGAVLLPGIALLAVLISAPRVTFVLFALSAVSLPYMSIELGIRLTLSEGLLALAWLGVLLRAPRDLRLPPWGRTEWLLLLLMGYSVVPFLYGELAMPGPSGLVSWLRWLLNLSTLFLVGILFRSEEGIRGVALALVLGMAAMLLLSIPVFLADPDPLAMLPVLQSLGYVHTEAMLDIFSGTAGRMGSPWVHPNLLGGMLALLLPVAVFLQVAARGGGRAVLWAVTLLGVAGLLLSISRGAILALGLVLTALAVRGRVAARRLLLLGSLLAVLFVAVYPPVQERLGTMFSAQNESTQLRFDEYRLFPEAVARYPLGIGFKSDPPPPGSGLLGISNLWLNYMYKLGLPAMFLFIAVLIAWWRETSTHVVGTPGLAMGLRLAGLAALLTGPVDHYFSFSPVAVAVFWTVMGLALSAARGSAPGPRQAQDTAGTGHAAHGWPAHSVHGPDGRQMPGVSSVAVE